MSGRVGLGCMRLSTDAERDDTHAIDTLRAALDTFRALEDGTTLWLDTAHAYGRDDDDLGHNERLVARALVDHAALRARIVVVTKAGMTRPGGRWQPDARASSLRASAERSLRALGGSSLDVLLLHAPDPRVSFATSVRALAALQRDGLARHVGLSNVSVTQLRAASDIVDVACVQVALSPLDDTAIRAGVVAWCTEHAVPLLAHTPLGGPKRVARLLRDATLARISARTGVSSGTVAIAWLRTLAPIVVPIPGARRVETARDAINAALVTLDDDDRAALDARFGLRTDAPGHGSTAHSGPATPIDGLRSASDEPHPEPIDGLRSASTEHHAKPIDGLRAASVEPRDPGEVVLLIGIPGAGKSTLVRAYVERGYERLNRDLEGTTVRQLVERLDARLAAGARRFVLDNTHATRASRHDVVAVARRHDVPVRCVWLDTPLAQAQVNAVDRLITRYGALPDPAALRTASRKDPHAFQPNVQHRFRRELEPPSLDEGFCAVDVVAFVRTPRPGHPTRAVVITLDVLAGSPPEATNVASLRDRMGHLDAHLLLPNVETPLLALGWLPDAHVEDLLAIEQAVRASMGCALDLRFCPHPGGPPICWCRPPLPGLLLSLVHQHRLDPAASTLVGSSDVHERLAAAVGFHFERAASA